MPPKKKSAKKKDIKVPVGRPRKNLGTRVSDLPLVSIVKPTTRRINVDSLAINRARLAYKRDSGKVLDERTARALIDAMSTTKRGPIGTAVVGTFKGKDVELGKQIAPGKTDMKESSGFFNYYKQAKAALEKNPKQKVKVKVNADGSYTYTTPGIPAVVTGTLAATSVPKSSSKDIASQTQMRSVSEKLMAKSAALQTAIDSGNLDDGATALALAKMEEYKKSLYSLAQGEAADASPMDEAAELSLERTRQREIVTSPSSNAVQVRSAQAQVKRIDRQITALQRSTGTQASIPAREADIIAAVLGEPEEEPRRPLVRPTRTIRRDDPGPSRQSAPATAAAAADLSAALADPVVSAIVEQVQENAPTRRVPSERAKANMQKIAKDREIKRDRNTEAALRARFAAEAQALENQPGRTREQIAADRFDQDFTEREAIAQSARDDGARILAQAQEQVNAPRKRAIDKKSLLTKVREAKARRSREGPVDNVQVGVDDFLDDILSGIEEAPVRRAIDKKSLLTKLREAKARRSREGPVDQEFEEEDAFATRSAPVPSQEPLSRNDKLRQEIRQAMFDRAFDEEAAARGLSETEAARVRERERQEQELRDQEEQVRAEYERRRLAEYDRAENERRSQGDAASKIQAAMRSALARNELKARAERAYRPAQGPVYDEQAANERDAAMNIQRLFRGNRSRKEQEEERKRATLDDITRALRSGDDDVAKRDAMDDMLDKMYEGSIPSVDVSGSINRDAASKIQALFRRSRRRPAGEQADLDAQYANIFSGIEEAPVRRAIDKKSLLTKLREAKARRSREGPVDQEFEEEDAFSRDALVQQQAELDARYADLFNDIDVPGADIRPNTRTIPVPPPLPRRPTPLLENVLDPIDEAEDGPLGAKNTPKSGFERKGLSEKGLAEAAKRLRPFEGQQTRISDFSPGDLSQQALREQRGRLKRVVTQEEVAPVVQNLLKDVISDALFARRLAVGPDAPVDDTNADWETSPNPYSGRGLVGGGRGSFIGGVIRRLRGMGYFDGFDSLMYNIHGTPDDNKKDLADAKAAYAARGGAMGGAMGGSIVLSGVPAPMTGGGSPVLYEITFPVKDWKTSSSLRWLRSNGIKPMKKAMQSGSVYKYAIASSKGLKDPYTSDLVSRGRKIHMTYGMA